MAGKSPQFISPLLAASIIDRTHIMMILTSMSLMLLSFLNMMSTKNWKSACSSYTDIEICEEGFMASSLFNFVVLGAEGFYLLAAGLRVLLQPKLNPINLEDVVIPGSEFIFAWMSIEGQAEGEYCDALVSKLVNVPVGQCLNLSEIRSLALLLALLRLILVLVVWLQVKFEANKKFRGWASMGQVTLKELYGEVDMAETSFTKTLDDGSTHQVVLKPGAIPPAQVRLAAAIIRGAMRAKSIKSTVKQWNQSASSFMRSWANGPEAANMRVIAAGLLMGIVLVEEPTIPGWAFEDVKTVAVIKIIILAFFSVDIFFKSRAISGFMQWKETRLTMLVIAFLFADPLFVQMGLTFPGSAHIISLTVAVRPYFLIVYSKPIKNATVFSIDAFMHSYWITAMLCIQLFYFSLVGFLLFRGIDDYEDFMDFRTSLISMYTLEDNFPDVMVAPYQEQPLYCLFFMAYLVCYIYVFNSLFLSILYERFTESTQAELKEVLVELEDTLSHAFELMSEEITIGKGVDAITMKVVAADTWMKVCRLTRPDLPSEVAVIILKTIMKECPEMHMELDDFLDFCSFLSPKTDMKLEVEENTTGWWCFDRDYGESNVIPVLIKLQAKLLAMFEYTLETSFYTFKPTEDTIDLCLLINSFFVVYEVMTREQDEDGNQWNPNDEMFHSINDVFLWIYTVEMILKVFAFAPKRYFGDQRNVLDFVLTTGCLLVEYRGEALGFGSKMISLFRLTRLVRLLAAMATFRALIRAFNKTLGAPAFGLLGSLLCFFYFFAALGMKLYAHKLNLDGGLDDDDDLIGDEYYLDMNFDSMPNAMLTLWVVFVASNWSAWLGATAKVTDANNYLYFIFFYFAVDIVMNNIVVGFIIDSYVSVAEALSTLREETNMMRRLKQTRIKSNKKSGGQETLKLDVNAERNLVIERYGMEAKDVFSHMEGLE